MDGAAAIRSPLAVAPAPAWGGRAVAIGPPPGTVIGGLWFIE
jgi:hypothetical protein